VKTLSLDLDKKRYQYTLIPNKPVQGEQSTWLHCLTRSLQSIARAFRTSLILSKFSSRLYAYNHSYQKHTLLKKHKMKNWLQ
jgi:hypothetical protein